MNAVTQGSELPFERVGPYELIRTIGRGNLGTVYLARDPGMDVEVALKVFDLEAMHAETAETAKKTLTEKARACERLIHENVAGILSTSMDGEQPFIAMQRVFNGRSLVRYCEPDSRLPLEDVVRIIRACAVGLHFAHTRGVIHGDIKPRNILLGVGFEPKLVDFGLSELMRSDEKQSPRYLSPEHIKHRDIGPASDVFNLGVVLYELIVGRHPFKAATFDRQSKRIINSRHVRVRKVRSDVPKELQTITNRCLAKSAANRYETAAHLAADLDVVLDMMAASSTSVARQLLLDSVRDLDCFSGMSEQDLKETLHHCSVHRFRPGDEIIAVGDEANCFYVVVDGEVGIRREEVFEITHLEEGECVGEVGALTGKARTATVIAMDRCTLISVPMSFVHNGPMSCQIHLKNALLDSLAWRLANALDSVC